MPLAKSGLAVCSRHSLPRGTRFARVENGSFQLPDARRAGLDEFANGVCCKLANRRYPFWAGGFSNRPSSPWVCRESPSTVPSAPEHTAETLRQRVDGAPPFDDHVSRGQDHDECQSPQQPTPLTGSAHRRSPPFAARHASIRGNLTRAGHGETRCRCRAVSSRGEPIPISSERLTCPPTTSCKTPRGRVRSGFTSTSSAPRIASGGEEVSRGEQADGTAAQVWAATSTSPAWGGEAGLGGRFDVLCFEVRLDAFLGAFSAKA